MGAVPGLAVTGGLLVWGGALSGPGAPLSGAADRSGRRPRAASARGPRKRAALIRVTMDIYTFVRLDSQRCAFDRVGDALRETGSSKHGGQPQTPRRVCAPHN